MAYQKKVNNTVSNQNDKNETKNDVIAKTVKKPREYKSDDLIPCRSITRGELILVGKKTKEVYIWSDYGDVTEIEYQDLLALKAAKSSFVFDILFVIDDEELIASDKWKDVKSLYDKIYSQDVNELINMDVNGFKRVLPKLPLGLQKAIITEVSTQIENGTFDSIQKIKAIDEILKTDLASML